MHQNTFSEISLTFIVQNKNIFFLRWATHFSSFLEFAPRLFLKCLSELVQKVMFEGAHDFLGLIHVNVMVTLDLNKAELGINLISTFGLLGDCAWLVVYALSCLESYRFFFILGVAFFLGQRN